MIYVEKENLLEPADLEVLLKYINRYSHKKMIVSCDFQVSDKCRKQYSMEFRQYVKLTENNHGKLPCIFCSRTMKFSNRNNPNTKYHNLDDNFFEQINTDAKAYLLGWIASDGHIGRRGFKIAIHQKDIETLEIFQNLICKDIPIKQFTTPTSKLCSFEVNSQKISKDLCTLLKISPGKKDATVCLPDLRDDLKWSFLRGYFDGDGSVNDINITKYKCAKGNIRSNSSNMLTQIKDFIKCGSISCNMLCLSNKQMMYFLNNIYNNSEYKLSRKYARYLKWMEKERGAGGFGSTNGK
jgi:hypothetical protein